MPNSVDGGSSDLYSTPQGLTTSSSSLGKLKGRAVKELPIENLSVVKEALNKSKEEDSASLEVKDIKIRNSTSFTDILFHDEPPRHLLDSVTIDRLNKSLASYSVKLNPTPFIPFRSNAIDQTQLAAWINAHPEACRPAVKELAEKIKHIGMEEFLGKVYQAAEGVNEALQNLHEDSYIMIVAPEKSNLWVSELALSKLTLLPKEVVAWDQTTMYEPLSSLTHYLNDQLTKNPPHSLPGTIVLFDDGIYSGEQMGKIINNIFSVFEVINKSKEKEGDKEKLAIPKIVLAPVYATQFGIKNIMERNKQYKDNISVINHERIYTISDVMSEGNLKIIEKMYWPDDNRPDDRTKDIYLSGGKSRGNIYFDFKIPDGLSFPDVDCGYVYDENGRFLREKIPFIPDTEIKPYNSEYPEYYAKKQKELLDKTLQELGDFA